ncbi:multicopper oxidase family protein [Streptomyces sp. JB150]|uniref:multicopper oxidase family protein n=1 Tax=Streptomyces sp. JB150 TaxID=2714844 RepID=UPI00140BC0F7|nr:multicopper oxidase family protein [Streptomyces sp. JB150]QIJ66436.1 multicopper oxidase family protein [Streptomyces sp. JB150]
MFTPSRRTLLRTSFAAGAGLLAGCSGPGSRSGSGSGPGSRSTPGLQGTGGEAAFVPAGPRGYVNPSDPEVLAAERERGSGPVRTYRMTAGVTTLDLGGRTVRSWAYDEALPGPLVRVTAGDTLDLALANRLPATTTLHSHGLRLRCDMDGVPGLTQRAIPSGADFVYRFVVPHPGTYLLHSHVGMQPDRALYAPFVVDDPREPLSYDKEWIVVLDDWLDGVEGSTPEAVLDQLLPEGAEHMAMGPGPGTTGPSRVLHDSYSRILHGEGGNVAYPHYLVNGRVPSSPSVFRCRPGDRVRLRIINAGSDTAFRVALGDHEMTVTHTDGYPVKHRTTDALLVGMAERYDVLVTARDGVFPLIALPEGKKGEALAVLRTSTGRGQLPPPSVRPDEVRGKTVPARRLQPDDSVALDGREPDREMRIRLTGGMEKYDWGFDHQPYSVRRRYPVRAGERVRLTLINATDMWHPLHLHGHTFALTGIDSAGALKDTAVVLPHRKLVIDFDADNPGLWMLHCHNQYHSESGMMTVLGYRK